MPECQTSRVPQSRAEWDEVKQFADQVFVDIDRPEEHLVTITIEINGDTSGGVDYSWNGSLSAQEQQALVRHAAEELRRSAEEDWAPEGHFAQLHERMRRASPPET